MRLRDQEDLARFFEELNRETDRGLALVGASLIDEKLMQTLKAFFCDPKAAERLLKDGNAPLATFSSRADTCLALGLIDDFEYREITLVRKVRNAFAHAIHGTTFRTPKIAGYCSSLQSNLPEGDGYPISEPRFRLTNSVVSLVIRLYHRPNWVKKESRTPKIWVAQDQVRWRRVDEEPPPQGIPLLVLAKGKSGSDS